jgi:prohibitin 1
MRSSVTITLLLALTGCTTVEPGHMGLMFKSLGGGLQRDKLTPGTYFTGLFSRIEDFDITYSTHQEQIETTSSEGLHLTLKVSVIYRPVVDQLYDLDADIGLNYYDEVIGPEFRSAARGIFAHHSYQELLKKNEQIEDEIEADLRRRTNGKHVEISSVTLEALQYAPEISTAVQEKLAAEQDALRQKTLLENENARRQMQIQNEAAQAKLRDEETLRQNKFRAEEAIRQKQQETELAKQQAELDKITEESEASKRIIKARAEAEEAKLVAKAKAEEARAVSQTITPLQVMMHGYDALKEMGNSGAHIYLGDWSKVPNFLFPPSFQAQLNNPKREAEPKP